MKTKLNILLKILKTSSLLLLLSCMIPLFAYGDNAGTLGAVQNFTDCNSACTQYNNDKNTAASCPSLSPSPEQSGSQIWTNGILYSDSNQCQKDVAARWGVVGEYCDGMSAMKTAKPLVIASTTLYSAIAAVCWAGCFGYVPAQVGCSFGSAATSIYDTIASSKVSVESQKAQYWWAAQLGTNWASYGAGAIGGVTGAAGGVLLLSNKLWKVNNSRATTGLMCGTAAYLSVAAAIKGANLAIIQKIIKDTCTQIEQLPAITGGFLISPNSSPSPSISPTGGGKVLSQSQAGSTSALSLNQLGMGAGQPFPSGLFGSAATAAPVGSVIGNMPAINQVPNALSDMGSSLGNLAQQLQSGAATAGSAISSALPSSMPSGIKSSLESALNKLDTAAKNGTLSIPGINSDIPSIYSSGARKTASTEEGNPFAMNKGSSSVSGVATTKEQAFSSSKKNQTGSNSSDSDIFHSNWNGNIFDIVTNKLKQNKENVEQLEWDTPLNRALMGLAKKQKSE